MRGIILAGGAGTRLRPLTSVTSKQLLPVYDKPMIYYPLSVLLLAGIREILIITTPESHQDFHRLLGDGERLGIRIEYAQQDEPRGLADAFLLGRRFIGDDQVCLVLGDNIFHGQDLPTTVRKEVAQLEGATLFGYQVDDPRRYGIAVLDEEGRLLDIEEKPTEPKSDLAVTGLYLYDNDVVSYAAELSPSARGELEITDINRRYVEQGRARLVNLGSGTAWLDTGTHDSLFEAAGYVHAVQTRQGVQIACIEEVAFQMGFIGAADVANSIDTYGSSSDYGRHLARLLA